MKKSIRDKLTSKLLDELEERIRVDYDKWRIRRRELAKSAKSRPANPSRRPVKKLAE